MKKFLSVILTAVMMLSLAACGGAASSSAAASESTAASSEASSVASVAESTASSAAESTAASVAESAASSVAETEGGSNILVAYFSYSGNTRGIAEKISTAVGGTLFEIDTTYDYPAAYNDVLDVAQDEKAEGARPELSAQVENMDDYDVVFIGYPNWWGDMPMVVYSFFDAYDLSGKTVVPFVTSSSSGFSNTLSTIASLEPGATITDGLSIRDSALGSADDAISTFLTSIDY